MLKLYLYQYLYQPDVTPAVNIWRESRTKGYPISEWRSTVQWSGQYISWSLILNINIMIVITI